MDVSAHPIKTAKNISNRVELSNIIIFEDFTNQFWPKKMRHDIYPTVSFEKLSTYDNQHTTQHKHLVSLC
jgi:hypothetical protein